MTAKTVYLHAGLPKTGSSAIQQTAYEHREALEQAGIRYWSVAARQGWPLTMALGVAPTERGGVPEHRAKSYEKKFGQPATLRAGLLEEIDSAQGKFLISTEKISVFSVDTIRALAALVGSSGAAVKAIAYVREPRSLISSAVQQNAKVGIPAEDVLERLEVLPYQGRVGRLIEALGEENVMLRLYKRGGPGRDSLFADLLLAMGEDPGLAVNLPMDNTNSSMSARAVDILEAINRIAKEKKSATPTNWFCNEYLLPHFHGPSFEVDQAVIKRLIEKNADQIVWMSQKLGLDLLAVAPPLSDRARRPDPIDNEMAGLIYSLFSDLAQMRVEVKRARGAAMTAANRGEDAERVLLQAERRKTRKRSDSSTKRSRPTKAERLARKEDRMTRKKVLTAQRGKKISNAMPGEDGPAGGG